MSYSNNRILILVYDNFDSFTYNLVDYLNQLGSDTSIVRNNTPLKEIDKIPFHGIILSPGPGIPEKSGHMMGIINKFHMELPILGICLGHQALGTFFGATLTKAIQPKHGKLSRIHVKSDYLFQNTDFLNYMTPISISSIIIRP